jgi:hypothetical protein
MAKASWRRVVCALRYVWGSACGAVQLLRGAASKAGGVGGRDVGGGGAPGAAGARRPCAAA